MRAGSTQLSIRTQLALPEATSKPLKVALAITIAAFLFTLLYYSQSQPELPIFYSLPRPSQQLAQKEYLFLFPILSLAILSIHVVIIRSLRNYDELVLRLFSMMTTVIEGILLLALLRIIYITW